MEPRPLVSLLVGLGFLAGAGPLAAQECSHGREPNRVFPFFAASELGIQGVTVYVTQAVRDSPFMSEEALQDAVGEWNACPQGHVPTFTVNWQGTAPVIPPNDTSSMEYRSSILVDLNGGHAPVNEQTRSASPALWEAQGNRITLFARCPTTGTFGMACLGDQPGTSIRWDLDGYLEAALAHEFGHSLGLDHDQPPSAECRAGVMKPTIGANDTGLHVLPRHCALADVVNNPEAPCNSNQPAAAGETHPCDSEARPFQNPNGGPDGGGTGHAGLFCQEYPWSCSSPHPWAGGGLACDWACVTVTDASGTSSICSWGCYPVTAPGETSVPAEAQTGVAPLVSVRSPTPAATVSGVVTIVGWAVDALGIGSITFGVDGQIVPVTNYVYGFRDQAACTPPTGSIFGWCNPNSGFSARLDTTRFTNGAHELQIVAFDSQGWATSVEVPIFVDNPVCADTTPPSVSVTSPASGATVTGSVQVSAAASDNVGVTQVKFLLDGSVLTTDSAAPWSFTWNTAASGGGSHTLQARAFDACGNSRTSAPATVTVVVPPDIAVYQAFDGIEVPRGGSSTISDTSPNVASSRRFRIANLGGSSLSLFNPGSLISAPCLDLSELPASPVGAGGETFFRVRLLCPTAGTYSGLVTIQSNDPDEASYSFTVSGNVIGGGPPPPAPDIAVYQDYDSIEVPQGGTSTINTTAVNVAASRRFRITNSGSANLSLSNPSSLVTGTCLSLSELPVTPVPPGGTAYFRVRLYCATPGTYNGTVSIQSNDPNEAAYSFTVTGTVTP